MIPCFKHRGARIVPTVRMYQNGPEPTRNGAEPDECSPPLELTE
jgi:hypothetical protein